jgi:aldehyde:ferredoxin oxidoreductase
MYEVSEGPYAGTVGEGPEYETLNALGSKLGNADLASILRANTLANQYGLDTMSLGTTIAFATECYEAGLLDGTDTGGLELTWGNSEAMVALVDRIARREGIGDLLAEGSVRAARQLGQGAERYAMHVKGMELPASDPRGSLAAALSYAVSSRGGDHLRAGFVKMAKKWKPEDALRLVGTAEAVDGSTPAGKAALVCWEEDLSAVADALGVCLFICSSLTAVGMADFARALSEVTGWRVEEDELWLAGRRITTLERVINLRYGLEPADDGLPERFRHEPLPEGMSAGRTVVALERMVADYYALRGWDAQGVPTDTTLEGLGLGCLASARDG